MYNIHFMVNTLLLVDHFFDFDTIVCVVLFLWEMPFYLFIFSSQLQLKILSNISI